MAQQYSLKWNNHQPNFISMFAMLRNTQALVDVTLAAEGRHLHAHKMVLSACSPYFHSLFVENPSRHPIVILKDVAFSDLRTIVDFMYYGEVNITQEELPQMLHSAKSLKVKGLTETESTSVMRSQSSDFPFEAPGEASGEHAGEPSREQAGEPLNEPANEPSNEPSGDINAMRRTSASPANSPSAKRRRRRRSSNASTSLNMVGEEHRDENHMEIVRDGITLSTVPRRREFSLDGSNATQQNADPQNISIDDLNVDHNPSGMPQDLLSGLRLRCAKHLKRQARVEEQSTPRQASEPSATPPALLPAPALHLLRKHNSYPQFAPRHRRPRPAVLLTGAGAEQRMGSLLIRAVSVSVGPPPTPTPSPAPTSSPAPTPSSAPAPATVTPRASHTPAIRSGPPLSCNFCWNTVDECGRILRRKTQYHCPECRTNLCIVPCFHEYHEAESELASAR